MTNSYPFIRFVDDVSKEENVHTLDNYSISLLVKLKHQREEQKGCDLIIHAKDGRLYTHRCLLGLFSPMLLDMSIPTEELMLPQFHRAALEPMIEFLYTGVLRYPAHLLNEVRDVVQYFNMKEIQLLIANPSSSFQRKTGIGSEVLSSEKSSTTVGTEGTCLEDYLRVLDSLQKDNAGLSETINFYCQNQVVKSISPSDSQKPCALLNNSDAKEGATLKLSHSDVALKKRLPHSVQQNLSLPSMSTAFCQTPETKGHVQPQVASSQKRKAGIPRKVQKTEEIQLSDDDMGKDGVDKDYHVDDSGDDDEEDDDDDDDDDDEDVDIDEADVEIVHLEASDEETNKTTRTRSARKRRKNLLKCAKCPRTFARTKALQKHLLVHKEGVSYKCHVCGMNYARMCDYTRHVRTHIADDRFKCNYCQFDTKTQKNFLLHNQTSHSDDKPFRCDYQGCNFGTVKFTYLTEHQRLHSDTKCFRCEKCGASFAQPGGLYSHLKSCFEKQEYLCDLCGQVFNHLGSMKSHRRIHVGEKPYICPDCGSRFADHRNMKRHRLIHQNAYPYPCPDCDKRFRHSNSLKAHAKTHGSTSATPPTSCYDNQTFTSGQSSTDTHCSPGEVTQGTMLSQTTPHTTPPDPNDPTAFANQSVFPMSHPSVEAPQSPAMVSTPGTNIVGQSMINSGLYTQNFNINTGLVHPGFLAPQSYNSQL